jgi:hypothetical protein
VLQQAQGDIEEGILRCAPCHRIYPIAAGIPRILPNALPSAPDFCQAHAAVLASMGFDPDCREIRRFEKLHKKTARAFGFEWNTYQVTPFTAASTALFVCVARGRRWSPSR